MQRAEQSIKNFEIFLVDNLRGYCCEPSQRTGNQVVDIWSSRISLIISCILSVLCGDGNDSFSFGPRMHATLLAYKAAAFSLLCKGGCKKDVTGLLHVHTPEHIRDM
jgi:hypothetical protein